MPSLIFNGCFGRGRTSDHTAMTVRSSAEAAAGDLADYFSYGVFTGHRPGNLTEWQLSDFLCGRTRR